MGMYLLKKPSLICSEERLVVVGLVVRWLWGGGSLEGMGSSGFFAANSRDAYGRIWVLKLAKLLDWRSARGFCELV